MCRHVSWRRPTAQTHGERAEVWEPPAGSGVEPLVEGHWVSGGFSPEAESFLAFGRPFGKANLHPFIDFATSENHGYLLSYIPPRLPTLGSPATFVSIPAGTP